MRRLIAAGALAGMVSFAGPAGAVGCISGGIAGGVAGHYAGHHAVLGAVAGCIAGHHLHKVQREHAREQRQAAHANAAQAR